MNVLGLVFGSALVATGAAGWVVNTRVNGNVFGDLRERLGGHGGEIDETDWAGRADYPGESLEGDEADDFSYAGRVDYKPGAKRRLLALVFLIIVVAVVGAIVAGLIGLVVWAINAGITGYMNSS